MRIVALLVPALVIGCTAADSSEIAQTDSAEVEAAHVELTVSFASDPEHAMNLHVLTVDVREGSGKKSIRLPVGEALSCETPSTDEWKPAEDKTRGVLAKLIGCGDGRRMTYVGLFAKKKDLIVVSQTVWPDSRDQVSATTLSFSTLLESDGKLTFSSPSIEYR